MEPRKIQALLTLADATREEIAAAAKASQGAVHLVIQGLRRNGPVARRVMRVIEKRTRKRALTLWGPPDVEGRYAETPNVAHGSGTRKAEPEPAATGTEG